ncbi:probable 1-acyl-sn-glycerol-3-phosphate acyltransferase 4 [Cucurbita maxima]|uniref:1-acylglycerol-3-phosphate O-acyltransferase n=1 Tax=Cucurbita maxima TaxID=3661 RepID=A0A6J1K4Q5_CUCMA|nr:probable 1-acyl-sn-glycerol-3-phosphate acyltransferase 4 [Cucurbita maxima]
MDASTSLQSDKTQKFKSLGPFRLMRGVVCLAVFLSTAFMFLVYFAPIVTLSLRLISLHYCRKATSIVFGFWLALWPFLFEVINGTKVFFYGDNVPVNERVLLIANHRTEVDWMYLWDFALRKGSLGCIKYILKSSLMKLPLFGWGFHSLEFIPVERKWEVDGPVICRRLSTFKNPRDPLWLAVFPEGTDFTEAKCKKSQAYAAEVGLPVLKNVLLPKARGFCACLRTLRGSLDAVYDVTIAYKPQCPTFTDNVFGLGPSEVHIHVQRIPAGEVPASDEGASAWLMDKFKLKDHLLSYFTANGCFPEPRIEEKLSAFKCSMNFILVISLTAIFSYLTFYSFWSKVYVALSCIYLASVTYLRVQPEQGLSFLVSTLISKKQSTE